MINFIVFVLVSLVAVIILHAMLSGAQSEVDRIDAMSERELLDSVE